jgi:hypothetical protein
MSGKPKWFQHITVRPEPVEGETVGLGNSPFILDFAIAKGMASGRKGANLYPLQSVNFLEKNNPFLKIA